MWRRTKQGKESVRRDHLHREQTESSQQSASIIGFKCIVLMCAQDSRFSSRTSYEKEMLRAKLLGQEEKTFSYIYSMYTYIHSMYTDICNYPHD